MPLNPERVVRALTARLPEDAQVSVDVGSVVYWYARHLTWPPGVPAHLSSTPASMCSGLPYGLAAKLAAPDRLVVTLVGTGHRRPRPCSPAWRQGPGGTTRVSTAG